MDPRKRKSVTLCTVSPSICYGGQEELPHTPKPEARGGGLEEELAGIKIAERNINKLKYADDTTVMAESDKEL